MRVFVAGATGAIGTRLVCQLIEHGHEVIGTYRSPGHAEGASDGPIVHVHAVLGLSDGTTRGGHLLEGKVFPTLEVVVTETPAQLR